MVIDELIITNFGKFNNRNIQLKEGINVIYGANEAGKSTAFSFIKAMFFGLTKSRSRNIQNDEYTLYEPWTNKGFYEGRMRIKTGGRTYRIERIFAKEKKEFHVIDETAGREIFPDADAYKRIIQDMTEETFVNTLAVGQLKARIGDELAAEVKNYVANLTGSKSVDIDVIKAIAELKKEKKRFEKKISDLEIEKVKYELLRYSGLEDEIEELANKLNLKLKAVEPPEEPSEEELEEKDGEPEVSLVHYFNNKSWGVIALIWVLSVILMFFAGIFAGVLTGTLTSIAFILILRFLEKTPAAEDDEEEEETEENPGLKADDKEIDKMRWMLDNLYEKKIKYDELKEEYSILAARESEYLEEIRAIEVAMKTIDTLSNDIQSDFGSDINELASIYIKYFTAGKYDKISVDEEFNVWINTKERLIKLEQLSRGTIEQVYLAVRMAVARLLFNEEKMPILLDESFAMYDDGRLLTTLEGITKCSVSQVIIFTCVEREMRLLERKGVPFNRIDL